MCCARKQAWEEEIPGGVILSFEKTLASARVVPLLLGCLPRRQGAALRARDFTLIRFTGSKDGTATPWPWRGWTCPELTDRHRSGSSRRSPAFMATLTILSGQENVKRLGWEGTASCLSQHGHAEAQHCDTMSQHWTFWGISEQLPIKYTKAYARWKMGLYTPALRAQFCHVSRGKQRGEIIS